MISVKGNMNELNKLMDFKGYYVDTEYYRLKVPREKANLKNDRIRCDILFHSRGAYNSRIDNLLAIEAKMEDSTDDGEKDIKRLADFVDSINIRFFAEILSYSKKDQTRAL